MHSRTATSSLRNDRRRPPQRARGYSLTEILVVIALIVILIAVAVPVLSVLSGNRSTEAAENQVAAVLNQARAQAISLQRNVGVAFFVDPASERHTMALVAQLVPPNPVIERLPEYDFVTLQSGTGIQFINDDWSVTKPPRDRYVRIGVIMFDGRGQVVGVPFQIGADSALGKAMDLRRVLQTMGFNNADYYNPNTTVVTQVGLVIYDNEAFARQEFDPAEGMKTPMEAEENTWLDQNAVPFVVNRYNGTLIRGE